MLVNAKTVHTNDIVLAHVSRSPITILIALLAAALIRVLIMLPFNALFMLISRCNAQPL